MAPTESIDVAYERLHFGFKVLQGYKVEAQLASGVVYEGIFMTANVKEGKTGVALKYPRVIKDPALHADKDAQVERLGKTKIIQLHELVQLVAKDVRMNPEDLAGAPDDLETDSYISRGRGGAFGRDLQRWVPDESLDPSLNLSLEDSGAGWDQFAVNEQRFGVQSTYDEHLYTTKINKDACAISEQEAARLAHEIMAEGTTRGGLAAYHIAEERGFEVDDKAMNEEDRYGAVVREVPTENGNRRSSSGGGSAAAPGRHGQGGVPPPPPPRAWGGAGAGVAAVAGKPTQPAPAPTANNGTAALSKPGGGPASSTALPKGGLSQNFAAVAAGAGPASGPGRASAATSWRAAVSAPQAPGGAETTQPGKPSPAVSIRHSGRNKMATEIDGHGTTTAALALAVPGPGTTPPQDRMEFEKWKAQKKKQEEEQERQRQLNELKNLKSAAHSSPGTSAAGAGATSPPTAASSVNATSSTTATGSATATTQSAASTSPAVAAATTTSSGSGTAAPAAAAAPASTTTAPVKSSLNPNAKVFTMNANAKPFVPGGFGSNASTAATTPAATTATPAVPPPPAPASTFTGKPSSLGNNIGPHAIPVHPTGIVRAAMPHAMPHADVHHSVPHGLPGHHVMPGHGEGMVHGIMHAPPTAMRVGPMPGVPHQQTVMEAHAAVGAPAGPHSIHVARPVQPAMPINPANGMPMVNLSPGNMSYGQPMPVPANAQAMSGVPAPANMMQAHMVAGPQVVYPTAAQAQHMRPAGMQPGAAQLTMQLPGGLASQGGFNFPVVPYGAAMGAATMPVQMVAHTAMQQGQAVVGSHGGDVGHLRR